MMQREFLALILIIILILSGGAYAAGRGSSGDTARPNSADTDSNLIDCEDRATHLDRKARIKCRLETPEVRVRVTDESRIPEACRRLAVAADVASTQKVTRADCRKLYTDIKPCYNENGRAKHACFRRVSGLGTAALSGNADKTRLRHYVVALLYEFEEKIEYDVDNGSVDTVKAAEVIDLITEIKELILNGGSRDEVRPLLANLKTQLRELRA